MWDGQRRPRAEGYRAFRARAAPGLRPEAQGPPARSWLTARAIASPEARNAPMLRKGSAGPGARPGKKPPKARPGCRKTPLVARREAPACRKVRGT
jgi:hypothetical protein